MMDRHIELATSPDGHWIEDSDMVFAGTRGSDAVRVFIALADWDRFTLAHNGENNQAARADLARIADGSEPQRRAPDGVYEYRVAQKR